MVRTRALPLVAAALALVSTALMPSITAGQAPVLGIDVYGTRSLTGDEVRTRYGESLDSLLAALATGAFDERHARRYRDIVQDIYERGDFAYVDLSMVSYFEPDQGIYLTVDVVERADSARRLDFLPTPTDTVPDPSGIIAGFQEYSARGMQLLQRGLLRGSDPPCPVLHCPPGFAHDSLHAASQRFMSDAPAHTDLLVDVLRRDADPQRRAAAAFLLGFVMEPQRVTDALVPAIRDPSSLVRNNVLRVLLMVARRDPPVAIPLGPVVDALDMPATTDRNKAGYLLRALAEWEEHRAVIIRTAGPTLLAMLELQQPNNHEPAWETLKLLSGEAYGARDYGAWRAWWERARGE